MNNLKNQQEIIFMVYGTLKKGHGNHVLLRDAEFLGNFETEPNYVLFDGGFPIVERGGSTSIKGELYKTSDRMTIARTFALEGCSSMEQGNPNKWYDFDMIETPHGKAVMFVMNEQQSGRTKVVTSGVWGV
jgi:gamma-glutamylcyclotransferase (GGCT)/AIG2-like uncharacterized protein YtfP